MNIIYGSNKLIDKYMVLSNINYSDIKIRINNNDYESYNTAGYSFHVSISDKVKSGNAIVSEDINYTCKDFNCKNRDLSINVSNLYYKDSLKLKSALDEYNTINKTLGLNTVYKLNQAIKEGREKELILFSEALHEKKIAEIAQKIKERGNVRMILIAGPSSSGKTTFAGKLGMALRVNGIKPVTISVDNYFVERENNPKDEFGNYDFECIEAIDTNLFNKQLLALLNGEEVALPTFDFTVGSKKYLGNTLKLKEDEVLIVEGIHCLNDKLTSLIPQEDKFKIYISDLTVLNIDYYNRISTTDTRLIRRIVRDNQFRNYSALHTLKMWYSVNRGEQKNIFPFQEEADVMFNSSIVYELAVLKDYAIPLLEEVTSDEPEYSEARRLIVMLKYFDSMSGEKIPNNSLIKEFIGGSIYE